MKTWPLLICFILQVIQHESKEVEFDISNNQNRRTRGKKTTAVSQPRRKGSRTAYTMESAMWEEPKWDDMTELIRKNYSMKDAATNKYFRKHMYQATSDWQMDYTHEGHPMKEREYFAEARLNHVTNRTMIPIRNSWLVRVCESPEVAKDAFRSNIQFRAKTALITRGIFRIGVSGGSLIKLLAEEILPKVKTDFSKWKIYFCDERMVPFEHPESTYGVYKSLLLNKFPGLTEDSFVPVKTHLSVEEAAKDYEATLRSHFPYEFKDPLPAGQKHFPRFDTLLLGLGPDGHTCSLFPGHPLMKEKDLWVAPIKDSPKPPPERVTFTWPVIQKARNIQLFLIGAAKADIVKRIIMDCERLPGFYINTTEPNCDVQWILDVESAKLIPDQRPLISDIASLQEKNENITAEFAPEWHNPDERNLAY